MAFGWTIGRKLAVLTGLLLAILAATSGFGIFGMKRMHGDFRAVSLDTTQALIDLSGTVDALHRVRIRVVSAGQNTDPAKLPAIRAEFESQLADLDRTWQHYAGSSMTAEEVGLARTVDAGLKSYRAFLTDQWPRITGGNGAAAVAEVLGAPGTTAFREAGTPLRALLDYQSREARGLFFPVMCQQPVGCCPNGVPPGLGVHWRVVEG